MDAQLLAHIATELRKATPPGWRCRVGYRRNGWVTYTIASAPVDLMAVEAIAHPDTAGDTFCKVNPLRYEQPWCDASATIGALWKVLCLAPRRELWIGTPRKPFAVQSK